MRTTYLDAPTRSIANLSQHAATLYELNRINVPAPFRGSGRASTLLKQVLSDADANNVTIVLNVHASGSLDHESLVEWYRRHGFSLNPCPTRTHPWMMERKPKEAT